MRNPRFEGGGICPNAIFLIFHFKKSKKKNLVEQWQGTGLLGQNSQYKQFSKSFRLPQSCWLKSDSQ